MRRVILLCLAAALAAALAWGNVYSEAWPLRCPLFQLTGWQCPFCGTQRAIHEALHGHLLAAWRLNYALPLFGTWLLTVAAGGLSGRMAQWQAVRIASSGRFAGLMLGLMLLWALVRNTCL